VPDATIDREVTLDRMLLDNCSRIEPKARSYAEL
jgi:hypothetical protein